MCSEGCSPLDLKLTKTFTSSSLRSYQMRHERTASISGKQYSYLTHTLPHSVRDHINSSLQYSYLTHTLPHSAREHINSSLQYSYITTLIKGSYQQLIAIFIPHPHITTLIKGTYQQLLATNMETKAHQILLVPKIATVFIISASRRDMPPSL